MALALNVTFAGTVGAEVVSLTANGTPVALAGRNYTVTVPATSSLVVLRTLTADRTETVRQISLIAAPTGVA